ncbi:MAG: DUF3817 domain-containing protein [Trueperaceae bacterium]
MSNVTNQARATAGTLAPMGYLYMITAFAEAVTWAGLLVGMYQKHVLGLEENLVPLFGGLHGLVFMLYLAVTWLASRALKWNLRTTALVLAAGVPPFLTIPVEIWLRRSGRLSAA